MDLVNVKVFGPLAEMVAAISPGSDDVAQMADRAVTFRCGDRQGPHS
jgi:hypothetical protein